MAQVNSELGKLCPQSLPLGQIAERHYTGQDIPAGFTRPFVNLYRLAAQFGLFDSTEIRPCSDPVFLSPAETRSFWILWQWWKQVRKTWEVAEQTPTSHLRHAAEGIYYEYKPPVYCAEYFETCLLLFETEFFDSPALSTERRLEEHRKDAALQSACYHTAMEFHCSLKDPEQIQGAMIAEGNARSQDRTQSSLHLPGLHPACYTGSSISSCPWIDPQNTKGLPFYLWDVNEMKTVEVQTLQSRPSYTAISHTWGRWRTGSWFQLAGVEDWQIPENSVFEVSQLPRMLAGIPTATPYVWFDLVCIPQIQNNEEQQNLVTRADDEIARQAAIFKNATHTIIWFNQVESWQGLLHTLSWMSAVYLEVDYKSGYQTAFSDETTGLFELSEILTGTHIGDMHTTGWFSSLWTLQEICLRPDMWLCQKDWQILTAGDSIPIAFNTIVALYGCCRETLNGRAALESPDIQKQLDLTRSFMSRDDRWTSLVQSGKYPRGFLELLELFDRTGMEDLHILKKEYILLLGSRRYCESRRDEAIMSVLDAKEWLLLPDQGGLVLGQYHLEFVREVARKIGASFFNSISARDIEQGTMTEDLLPVGSLMPFVCPSVKPVEEKMFLNWVFGEELDEPSVSSWLILQNGSVIIKKASILTSTLDQSGDMDGVMASIWLTHKSPDGTNENRYTHPSETVVPRRHRTVDLGEWCDTYFPPLANYVVEVGRCHGSPRGNQGASRGLLLKEVRAGSRELYKVGNYYTGFRSLRDGTKFKSSTPTVEVDWLVL